MRVVREEIRLDFAEAPRERDQLRLARVLVAKAHHRMLVERGLDAAELGVRQRSREIHAVDFGADDIRRWHDFHG